MVLLSSKPTPSHATVSWGWIFYSDGYERRRGSSSLSPSVCVPAGPFKPTPVSTGIPHPYKRVWDSAGTGAGRQKFARGRPVPITRLKAQSLPSPAPKAQPGPVRAHFQELWARLMIFPSPSPGLEPGLLKVCSQPIFGMLIESPNLK